MALPAAHGTMLLVLPGLDRGGMELQLLTLGRAFSRHGGAVTIVAGPGPLEPTARSIGRFEIVDWSSTPRETLARTIGCAGGGGAAVITADPKTIHLVPALAAAGPTHLCIHNRPGTFETWFNPRVLVRLRELVPALHASGRVRISAADRTAASRHAEYFGLPPGAVLPWLPGLDPPTGYEAISEGPIRRVAVVTRLSEEKLRLLDAAARFVAAGRARGAGVRLEVFGDGMAAQEARSAVAAVLEPAAFSFRGATSDPLRSVSRADAVVSGGRAAIEALMLGRRVATFTTDVQAPTTLGLPVTPRWFDELRDNNFTTPADAAACDASEVWRRLELLSSTDVRCIRDRTRTELSPARLLERHLQVLVDVDPGAPPGRALLDVVLRHAAMLDGELREMTDVADALWRQRVAASDVDDAQGEIG